MVHNRWYHRLMYFGLALAVLVASQMPVFLQGVFNSLQMVSEGESYPTDVKYIRWLPLETWQLAVLVVLNLAIIGVGIWLLYHWKFIRKEKLSLVTLVVGVIVGYIAISGIEALASWLMLLQGKSNASNQVLIEGMAMVLPFTFMFLSTAIFPAIVEELTFRGLLQIGVFGNTWWGYILASLLFGLMHGPDSWGALVGYAGMGLVFGWFTYRYKRLEYSIALHFVNNLIAVIFMYLA